MNKLAEAQLVICNEGNMCAVAMRDGDAPPGSKASSRTKGLYRNMGYPAAAGGAEPPGANSEGRPKLLAGCRKSDRPIQSMKSLKVTR